MSTSLERLREEAIENKIDTLQEMAQIRASLKRKLRRARVWVSPETPYFALLQMAKLLENK